jgi:protein-disulfide isomerase
MIPFGTSPLRSTTFGLALALVAGLLVALFEQQRRTAPPSDAAFDQHLFTVLSRPGFLERAMQAASQEREQERSRLWRAVLANDPALLDPHGPFTVAKGPAEATRRALVFIDYNCPHCRNFDRELERLQMQDPDIRIVVLPLALLRPSSGVAALSVLAAASLGQGAALHEALLRHEGEPTDDVVREEATRLGLSWDALLAARDGAKNEMARVSALAQRLGVQGTPISFLSSGVVINGAARAERVRAGWAEK